MIARLAEGPEGLAITAADAVILSRSRVEEFMNIKRKYPYYREEWEVAPMTQEEKAEAAGWVYHKKHPVIGKTWAVRTRGLPGQRIKVEVCFDDKVYYNPKETQAVTNFGGLRGDAGRNIHNIKKIFNGVIE